MPTPQILNAVKYREVRRQKHLGITANCFPGDRRENEVAEREAVSTGQRNDEWLSKSAEVQRLSWAAVATASYSAQLRLAVANCNVVRVKAPK
jgi:hypothetical protein